MLNKCLWILTLAMNWLHIMHQPDTRLWTCSGRQGRKVNINLGRSDLIFFSAKLPTRLVLV